MMYFVCFSVDGRLSDKTVTIPDDTRPHDLAEVLRQAVHPDRRGDPSDNLRGQRAMDCTLVNFIKLS